MTSNIIEIVIEPGPVLELEALTSESIDLEIATDTPGPPGEPGPPGAKGDKGDPGSSHAHRQETPAATWTINHMLGLLKIPTVVLDSDSTSPVTTTTYFLDLNTTVLEFPSAESGWAYV